MSVLQENTEYRDWLVEVKAKIKNSQIKAALKVNSELIRLYWEIGRMIVEKQERSKWGSGFIRQMAKDLKTEFPDMTGFSQRNLYLMRQFYLFYNQELEILHQLGAKFDSHGYGAALLEIPWRHHVLILQKIKDIKAALFYVGKTIENNWSRAVLEYQIETGLFNRQGKAISNFKETLPEPERDLAQQLLKDPYNFEFLTLSEKAKEKELEDKLVQNITDFLLELGKGFAYMGRQFRLKVGSREFSTDLLFYQTKLRAYVIIELKMKEFEPEYVGKLNFYITAVDELVKHEDDKPTIGILLCKKKDNIVVDFSLKDVKKPIGVSDFTYKELPEDIKNILPSESEFKRLIEKQTNKNKK
jgi:predicted nuclease of restriction endonuclease-like (RecB) superfamily